MSHLQLVSRNCVGKTLFLKISIKMHVLISATLIRAKLNNITVPTSRIKVLRKRKIVIIL